MKILSYCHHSNSQASAGVAALNTLSHSDYGENSLPYVNHHYSSLNELSHLVLSQMVSEMK